jgi:hypothetical protein
VDGIDGLLTRDLASSVPSHPVSDDVEPKGVVDEERVLVQLSSLAYVGQSRTVVLQLVLVQQ